MAVECDLDLASGRLHGQRFGEPDAPLVLAVHGLSANMHGFDHLAPFLFAADIASTVPTLTVTDVDADHFTVMTREPAAQALRALVG